MLYQCFLLVYSGGADPKVMVGPGWGGGVWGGLAPPEKIFRSILLMDDSDAISGLILHYDQYHMNSFKKGW